MVRRIGILIVAGVLAAGCGATADPGGDTTSDPTAEPVAETAEPAPTPTPAPSPARPASAAGGACHLLDFSAIFEHLGLAFDVSAANNRGDAQTCVVRATTESLPDLALTVVPTNTDADDFGQDLLPEAGEEVERLGRIGYRTPVPPADGRGPAWEITWLSGDGRLLTLVLTLPSGTAAEEGRRHGEHLLDLARTIDRMRI